MNGYLPPGATQNEIDRLIQDEEPYMQWDSATRRWIPSYPDLADGEDDPRERETTESRLTTTA